MIAALARLTMFRSRHINLIFHSVQGEPDPMRPTEPTRDWFAALMASVSRQFDVIPLSQAVSPIPSNRFSGRTISITFDDGYADNYLHALPVLEQYGVPATFFVATGFLDGGIMWNDAIIETIRGLSDGEYEFEGLGDERFVIHDWETRRHAANMVIKAWKHLPQQERQMRVDRLVGDRTTLSDSLMMSSDQLKALSASACADIGGHTRTHPILARIDADRAALEIRQGKEDLESLLDREVELFAYPNGKPGDDFADEHADMVRDAGFKAAVTTQWGTLTASTDRYRVPRFTPWHRNLDRFVIDLARCHHGMIQ